MRVTAPTENGRALRRRILLGKNRPERMPKAPQNALKHSVQQTSVGSSLNATYGIDCFQLRNCPSLENGNTLPVMRRTSTNSLRVPCCGVWPRLLTGLIRCCRFPRVGPSATALSITVTVRSGEAIGQTSTRHTSAEFVAFLK